MCIPSVRFNTTSVSRIGSERPLEKINDLTICKAGLGKFSGGFRKRCTNCSEVSCTSVTTPNRWETSEITFWGPTKKMMLKHESNEASEHSPYHHKEHTLITCLYYIYIITCIYTQKTLFAGCLVTCFYCTCFDATLQNHARSSASSFMSAVSHSGLWLLSGFGVLRQKPKEIWLWQTYHHSEGFKWSLETIDPHQKHAWNPTWII